MGFAAGDTNLYRYVGNNPTNLTDPSGLIAPREDQGKFTIYNRLDVFKPQALWSDVEVTYNVSVYDKVIYSDIKLVVYARSIRKNFVWGIFGEIFNISEEQWHIDNPEPGQTVGAWPAASNGPFWTDNPGMNLYRGLNISFYQEWRGEAWGLSKCDGKWHKLKEDTWGHKATLSGGQYKIERWPSSP